MSKKTIKQLRITDREQAAIDALRSRLASDPDVESIILFGSVARGDADDESDTDILVITNRPFSREERHEKVTHLATRINLDYDANLSTLVVDRHEWTNGTVSFLPIRSEIEKDGVALWTRT